MLVWIVFEGKYCRFYRATPCSVVVETTGLIDSSGLKFYITKTLRPQDAGTMELGLEYTDKMALPPGRPLWKLVGYCIPECTRVVINDRRCCLDAEDPVLPVFGFLRVLPRIKARLGFIAGIKRTQTCVLFMSGSKARSRRGHMQGGWLMIIFSLPSSPFSVRRLMHFTDIYFLIASHISAAYVYASCITVQ